MLLVIRQIVFTVSLIVTAHWLKDGDMRKVACNHWQWRYLGISWIGEMERDILGNN